MFLMCAKFRRYQYAVRHALRVLGVQAAHFTLQREAVAYQAGAVVHSDGTVDTPNSYEMPIEQGRVIKEGVSVTKEITWGMEGVLICLWYHIRQAIL